MLGANTSDIYPTLLEIVGLRLKKQPTLDGISLVQLINGKMKSRPKPTGFWHYATKGVFTENNRMRELLEAQKAGRQVKDTSYLRLNAGRITKKYPQDSFPGHAAWLDWSWKLHRIEAKEGITWLEIRKGMKWELYNLAEDPEEQNDLFTQEPERAKSMKVRLEEWQKSVIRSANGADYR